MKLEELERAIAVLDATAEDAGRDPAKVGLALTQNAFVWRDGDPWEVLRPGLVQQLGAYTAWDEGHDTPERDELVPNADEEEMRRWTIAGEPTQVAAALRSLVEPHLRRDEVHLVVRLHYPGIDLATAAAAAELFAAEVIPALRA